ncbi:MAG: hypothetical protein Q9224_007776, partial [Gallowayella concinna]
MAKPTREESESLSSHEKYMYMLRRNSYMELESQLEENWRKWPDSPVLSRIQSEIRQEMTALRLEMDSLQSANRVAGTPAARWDEGPAYWGKAVDASMRTLDTAMNTADETGVPEGWKELGLDVGIMVFWLLVALVWLRVKNWRRERVRNRRARRQLEQENHVHVNEPDAPGWVWRRAAEVEKIGNTLRRLYYHAGRVA